MNNNPKTKVDHKNVVLITDSYWPLTGGVETWVHAIAAHLAKKYSVSIITHSCGPKRRSLFLFSLFPEKPVFMNDDEGNSITTLAPSLTQRIALVPLLLWYIPGARKYYAQKLFDVLFVFYKLAFVNRLQTLIKNADSVHSFSTGYLGVLATQICTHLSIPLIHSPPVHFGKWGDSPLLMQSYCLAHTIMCLSHAFKTEFFKRMPKTTSDIIVVPVPVKKHPFKNGSLQNFNHPFILFLGRREAHKGADLLIAAFTKLSCNAHLVFAGPEQKIPTSGATIDLGHVDEPTKHQLLETCDVFCLPSTDESFGIVYVEAMMHKKPVVALDVSPVNEIIINNETGLLIEPGSTEQLTVALQTLLTNQDLRDTLGNNGYQRYCDYYEESVVLNKITNLYEKIETLRATALPI